MMTYQTLLSNLIDHVQSRVDDGETRADVTPETLKALSAPFPTLAPSATAPSASSSGESLPAITGEVAQCTRCLLHKTRTKTVPGQGHPHPDVMFIGEAPGRDEDRQGLAFVGRAGQLLTKMIEAMGYTREDVFIGNILKCRPPNNRAPLPEEMETCLPYLRRQIRLLQPKVIVALGATSAKGLLDSQTGISKLRGNWYTFEDIPLMPTYHPAYLLRNPAAKRDVWDDLKAVLKKLDRPAPEVKR